ncbi:hypothetical protein HYPSUDRAFT_76028 [Hypholoma sublateritium FD-334 SS-4]|uniref:Uncharacterized protein n=1 Tax=Hypholoma sublateritium (strain FD-334 SS-4) TaxID=945553 RepID=A0A0D2MMW2_HYPSF|nr:hypothetical protein HYPSUDRAFT_76028 [Hypholoma sublateritium FD-334 SS-4]
MENSSLILRPLRRDLSTGCLPRTCPSPDPTCLRLLFSIVLMISALRVTVLGLSLGIRCPSSPFMRDRLLVAVVLDIPITL